MALRYSTMNIKYGKPVLCISAISFFLMFFIVISSRSVAKKWFINNRQQCLSCSSLSPLTTQENTTSLCSPRATHRGFNQKVISISLFGPLENLKMFSSNRSLVLLQEMLSEMKEFYPDNWTLRVYHDEKYLNRTIIDYFESQYNSIDFCDVTDLNLSFIPPRIWRFLAAADELVGIMLSRDLDSPLRPRERAAVDEWLSSNLSFHAMRDHPFHVTAMMAGMWGFRSENNHQFLHYIRSKLFDQSLITRYPRNTDQHFLAGEIWPLVQSNAMTHDSYLCSRKDWNRYHRPFPTRRPLQSLDKYCYIGCPKPCCTTPGDYIDPCPNNCRPKEHQDWIYC